MSNKKVVTVNRGPKGWGGPLQLKETDTKKYVVSVTGGGIHPVAQMISDELGVQAIDGFNNKVEPSEMICVVIDCGGTARCGVYPKLNVLTINVNPISPSGPLMKFMTKENFVSGTTVAEVSAARDADIKDLPKYVPLKERKEQVDKVKEEVRTQNQRQQNKVIQFINKVGRATGGVVGVFYQAGRDAVDITITNILPFMAFISLMVGLITFTGLGEIIANLVKPLAGNIFGLITLSIFCAIPFLSPVLGPGAVIAQVIGVLIGVEIGKGTIPPSMALPALFAINSQVGADFIPVGLTLAEAETETVEIGVPAVLFSRLVTGPIAVLVAWLLSIGLYS